MRATQSNGRSGTPKGDGQPSARLRAISSPVQQGSAYAASSSTPRARKEGRGNETMAPTWQWLNFRGSWQDFDAAACSQIDRAQNAGNSKCTVSTPAGRIEIDFRKMTQRSLGPGAVERKVRRQATTGEDPGAASAPVQPSRAIACVSTSERRPLRHAGSAVVSRRHGPPLAPGSATEVSSRPVSRASRPSSRAAGDVDDESYAMALALSYAEEEQARRAHRREARGMATDSDAAVALMLANEQQEREETDAMLAAIIAAEGADPDGFWAFGAPRPPPHPDAADVDRMGYEELVALGERIGYARPNKPTAAQLARLPTRIVPESGPDMSNEECAVCCDGFAPGDELRTLPCLHAFHCRCIDEWLLSDMPGARSCPVCHSAVDFNSD